MISYTIDILQSFHIDIRNTSKFIINESLEQLMRNHAVNFNSFVTLPPRLSYEKDKIELFKLFQTFSENGPITMTWSNLPSWENFMTALKTDK